MPTKVLLLSESDNLPGAPRAAYRLHKSLRGIGLESNMLVRRKLTDDPTVFARHANWQRVYRKAAAWLDAAPLRLAGQTPKDVWTTGWLANGIERDVARINPDVAHLHWVGFGFVPISALPKFGRPIVWTLRDMNSFTGGCHYDGGCGRYRESCGACPLLSPIKHNDVSAKTLSDKKRHWENANITVVGLSNWIANMARQSAVFANKRVEVIPNGINLHTFAPMNKAQARQELGLGEDKKVIVFGATKSTADPRKGFHLLAQALQKLAAQGWAQRARLVVFGADGASGRHESGFEVTYLGTLKSEPELVRAYSAGDAFIAPSIEENFANTILEALACGTPCAGFNTGGNPDLITHQANGYLARAFEPDDLAAGMAWLLADETRAGQLAQEARASVAQRYDSRAVAERYARLYAELKKTPDR